MAETYRSKSPWLYFAGGVVTTLVVILVLLFGILGGSCAVRQCNAANPCTIGGVAYTSGNVCRAETSACGYIGSCRTRVVLTGTPPVSAPDCDCAIF